MTDHRDSSGLERAWVEATLEEQLGAEIAPRAAAPLGSPPSGSRSASSARAEWATQWRAAALVVLGLAAVWGVFAASGSGAGGRAPIRVVYLESEPNWEFRFLRSWMLREGPAEIRLHAVLTSADSEFAAEAPAGSTAAAEVPDSFTDWDVVIVGGLAPADWGRTPAEAAARQAALVEFCESGGGVAFLAGKQNWSGQLHQTPLAEVVPAYPEPSDFETGQRPRAPIHVVAPQVVSGLEAAITAGDHGPEHVSPRLGIGVLRPDAAALVREATTDGTAGEVFAAVRSVDRGRALALTFDTWQLRQSGRYAATWRALLDWLARRS